jgi:tetratricopeptide (TPR) repeat protein
MNPLRVAIGLTMILGLLGLIFWGIWRSIKRSGDPARMLGKWLLTVLLLGLVGWALIGKVGFDVGGAFIVPFVAVFIGVIMSIVWAPHLGAALAKPITSAIDGGIEEPVAQALYSVAEARRKQGRYHEAVREIRAQLAKFPTDVTGHLMLAEIQAEHLDDLPGAQLTIERFVAQPRHGPKNIAFALNSLADWHLKYTRDVEAARLALEKIAELLPDTEQSMGAAQRLAHLADADAVLAARERRPIRMRSGAANIGLGHGAPLAPPKELPPEEMAERLVKQLEAHPLDAESREKLAGIYLEHYDRLDLAMEQLEQLIQAPNQPAREVARWLNLIADWQVKRGVDYDAIQATLQRVSDRFPGLAPERLAQQRLDLLRLELKGKEQGPSVKLGAYEKDLGLKRGKTG